MIYLILINNQGQWKNESIHETVTKMSTVSAWWHYIPNAYIVKTTSTSKQIADYIIKNFPGLIFFITKVDLSDVNGILAKNAWDWIEKEKGVKIKLVNKPFISPTPAGVFAPAKPVYPKTGNTFIDAILAAGNKK